MATQSQSNIRSMVSPAFFNAIESFIMQKMDANDLFAKKVCNPKKRIPHSKPSNYPSPTATSSNATAPTTRKPNTTTKSSPSSTSTPTSSSLHKTKAASFRTLPLYLLLFYVDLATDIQSEFIPFSESLTIFFGREVKLRMCLVCCSRNPISEIL